MTISQEIQRNREIRAQREANLTLGAIVQGPLAGRRSGVRLVAAPAPREPTDADYLETKAAALKLLAELGIDIDRLPDGVKEDLDWALRNFAWIPTNPQASSPAGLGRHALDAIFDSLVRVKAEEAKHGEAAIDVSDHSPDAGEIAWLDRRIELLKQPIHEAELRVTSALRSAFNRVRLDAQSERQQAYERERVFNKLCGDGTLPELLIAYARWNTALHENFSESQVMRDAGRHLTTSNSRPASSAAIQNPQPIGTTLHSPQDPDAVQQHEARDRAVATEATLSALKQKQRANEQENAALAAQAER